MLTLASSHNLADTFLFNFVEGQNDKRNSRAIKRIRTKETLLSGGLMILLTCLAVQIWAGEQFRTDSKHNGRSIWAQASYRQNLAPQEGYHKGYLIHILQREKRELEIIWDHIYNIIVE